VKRVGESTTDKIEEAAQEISDLTNYTGPSAGMIEQVLKKHFGVGESPAAAPRNESVTQISVIRKHIENAELGDDHQHGDFETCEVCEQAQKSISYLQITGWQNAIILLRKLDELAAAPAAPLPPESNKP
jgi:hypothetical protein